MEAYEALASYYNTLIEYPYDAVADICRGASAGKKALDLFCGTGNFTFRLAERGFDAQGSDKSQAMLNVAMEKAREKGLDIVFKKENALKFSFAKPYDLITATSDGLNYLRSCDLNEFFSRISKALVAGGKFVFDVSTPYKLKHKLGNNLFYEEGEDLVYFWRNSYREKEGSVKMELTFFEKTADGTYIRREEEHKQYAHSIDEIKVLASCYDLSVEIIIDIDTFGANVSTSKRLLYILKKNLG
ncbi:MAG: class I SAM-dependent methyltransferase [Clostridia bacterium]|nr:class I SAM-dependent methyltransferase [Clostridia bacterium]